MNILAIRTDKPQAELYIYKDKTKLAGVKWQAHLKLAESLNTQIKNILNKSSISLNDLEAIVIFKGPGSFTGLRIGATVANSLAYSQDIPIIGVSGDNWLDDGVKDLLAGKNHKIVIPEYGSKPHITQPRK